jgi:hypothetical protein
LKPVLSSSGTHIFNKQKKSKKGFPVKSILFALGGSFDFPHHFHEFVLIVLYTQQRDFSPQKI